MAVNIWGIDPNGKKTIYYLRCPSGEAQIEIIRAKKLGWTGLMIATANTLTMQEEETPTHGSPDNRSNR